MHSTERRLWYIPGVLLSLLVVAALILTQTGGRVGAQILDVEASSTTAVVGEPITLSVFTGTEVEIVEAVINGDGVGEAVFESTGSTTAEQQTDPGYNTEAVFTVVPQEPGQIEIVITTPETNDTQTLTITILPEDDGSGTPPPVDESPTPTPPADGSPEPTPPADADEGTFEPAPGPEAGVHIARWGGGNISEAVEAVPNAMSLWATVNGQYVGYIPGAPDFANAPFMAAFPGGDIPAGTMMLVVIR